MMRHRLTLSSTGTAKAKRQYSDIWRHRGAVGVQQQRGQRSYPNANEIVRVAAFQKELPFGRQTGRGLIRATVRGGEAVIDRSGLNVQHCPGKRDPFTSPDYRPRRAYASEAVDGADLAVEIRYASADGGLEMAGRAGGLLLHQQDDFHEWGAELDVAYAPGHGGRGLRLSLEPCWNVPQMGAADSLWSGAAPGADADDGGAADAGASLRARLGYGVGAFGDLAMASPYSEMESGDGESRMQFGVELRGASASLEQFHVKLYGERDDTGEDVERRTMLEARLGI